MRCIASVKGRGPVVDIIDLVDSAFERAFTEVEEYVSDDERLRQTLRQALQAFGAGLLGDKRQPTEFSERALFTLGKRIRHHIERLQRDQAAQAEQRRRVNAVRDVRTLRRLQRMSPADFEYWCKGYFENQGFRDVTVTQLSKDFGVDLYMTCPDGKKAVVQCKRYTGSVGQPVVQQTYGVMHLLKAKRCYVVSTGHFSRDAWNLERKHDNIILLDGEALTTNKPGPVKSRTTKKAKLTDKRATPKGKESTGDRRREKAPKRNAVDRVVSRLSKLGRSTSQ